MAYQVLFITIDIDEEDHSRILEFFGLKESECPSMRYINLGEDMTKFKPKSDSLETDAVKSFVQDVLDGKIKVRNESTRVISINLTQCFW